MQQYAIIRLGLFSSYVNGKETSASDIDITFELRKGGYLGYEKNNRFKKFLESKLNKTVDLVRLKYMNPAIKIRSG